MKRFLLRLGGLALIVAGAFGLMFSLVALAFVARAKEGATTAILARVDLASQALDATAEGLIVVSASLTRAQTTLGVLEATTEGVARTLGESKPLINDLASLAGEDLPASITATQRSLAGVEASAKVVDDTLAALTSLPFIGTLVYAPQEPLHTSLAEVSDSLGTLSTSFQQMQADLNTTGDNLERVKTDVETLARNIGAMDASLRDAQGVVSRYQGVVASLQADMHTLRGELPSGLNLVAWGIALILIWLGVAQVGLLSQGLEMLGRSRREA
mgnify:CR=1 FL=1